MSDSRTVSQPLVSRLQPIGGSGLRWMLTAMLVAVLSTAALSTWAQPAPGGPGMAHRGGDHGRMGPMGPIGSGRHIDRMLDGLNASDAQRTQIKQIMQAAATDVKAQRDAGRTLRERAAQILSAPTIDEAAAESVRQQISQQQDQVSKRMLRAMIDAAKVLTPEQRAKLAERMKQRGDMMRERMQRQQRDEPRR